MKSFKNFLNEDAVSAGPAPANSMGAGIDGLPTKVDDGIAGYDKLMMGGKPLRRKPQYFGGKRVFTVNSNAFNKALQGKKKFKHYRSYVQDEETTSEIREYLKTNKDAPVIVQDEITGAMVYLNHGKRK
jgi:hypothetical protein